MKPYISWNKKLHIKRYSQSVIVLEVYDDINKKECRTFSLNHTAADIIQTVDGTKSLEDVIEIFSEKYNESFDSIELKVINYAKSLSKEYGIDLLFNKTSNNASVSITEERTIYPKVVSLELTNRCNIKCLHCYGDFGKIERCDMSLNDIKKVLFQFNELGVHTIELTGGELTVHPQLKEILLYALELNFEQIAFLTNGIALSDEIADIIINNKLRFVVQIDIHSLDDDYLHWFTKAPKTLEKIKRNIIKIAEAHVKMRTATVITHRNLHEIETIADWVHSLEIKHFGVSPVLSLGRAMGADKDLYLSPEDMLVLEGKLVLINNKYENFLGLIDSNRSESKNCGALTSHCVITAQGDVKICTMDNLTYFNSSIGNVLKTDVKTLYDENADYLLAFFNLQSPQFNSKECANCPHIYYCSACVLRALIKANELKDECAWFEDKVPDLLKEKLFALK